MDALGHRRSRGKVDVRPGIAPGRAQTEASEARPPPDMETAIEVASVLDDIKSLEEAAQERASRTRQSYSSCVRDIERQAEAVVRIRCREQERKARWRRLALAHRTARRREQQAAVRGWIGIGFAGVTLLGCTASLVTIIVLAINGFLPPVLHLVTLPLR